MLTRTKRFSLTLLEVMIALSLAAILISALMTTYYQASKKRIAAQELKKSSLSVELMRQRLVHLFAKTSAAEMPSFYTGVHPQAIGTCLIFTFNNGVDRSQEFCGDAMGMFYLNANRELCLASWGANGGARNEVLLENTEGLCLNFFDPKKKEWRSDWKKEDPFPPFFKISWSFSDQPKEVLQSAFFFPQDTPITYEIMVSSP
ncbi:MAG: type II secretion system protein [Parachlamydiales bacterium]|nr:type II secretion system protein [Verrucomicrobiota bacterium]MBX3718205.1 type II secretion system protein [Candidatus Acheromyda pituitae]